MEKNYIIILVLVAVIAALILLGLVPTAIAQTDFQKHCESLYTKDTKLEKKCTDECDLNKKGNMISALFKIQFDLDDLECESRINDDLCGGLLNLEEAGIEITPATSTIAIDETVQLSSEILAPKCIKKEHGEETESDPTGTVLWISEKPSIATVDLNSGLVTGKTSGQTQITAVVDVKLSDLIIGFATVTVGGHCDDDHNGILDIDQREFSGSCCCSVSLSPAWLQYSDLTVCPTGPAGTYYSLRVCSSTGELRAGFIPIGTHSHLWCEDASNCGEPHSHE